MFKKWKQIKQERKEVEMDRSSESENYLDQVQDEAVSGDDERMAVGRSQEGFGDNVPPEDRKQLEEQDQAQREPNRPTVELDANAVDEDEPEQVEEPKQVEDPTVIFVPFDDFEARVNQSTYQFAKDVPTKVSRDIANMLLDSKKGYTKD